MILIHHQLLLATGTGGGGECDPYLRPVYTATNLDLADVILVTDPAAANINICEELI